MTNVLLVGLYDVLVVDPYEERHACYDRRNYQKEDLLI
jgi:hypothetical protein